MSAFFNSASSQRLLNTATPITTYPLSVGLWVRPTTTGTTKKMWSDSDTAGSTNFFEIQQNSTGGFSAAAAGFLATAGTAVANRWFYIVARFISTINRQLSVLSTDGTIATGSDVSSANPVSIVNMSLGASAATTGLAFFDGNIAEWWITNTDIQSDGLALMASTLRQLAFNGPFSVPAVSDALVDYRSLRSSLGSETDTEIDYVPGRFGRKIWVNANGVLRSAHVPFLMPGWPAYDNPVLNQVV